MGYQTQLTYKTNKNTKSDIEPPIINCLTDSISIKHGVKLLFFNTLRQQPCTALAPIDKPFLFFRFTRKMYAKKAVTRPFNGFEPVPQRALKRAGFKPARCDCNPLVSPLRYRLVANWSRIHNLPLNLLMDLSTATRSHPAQGRNWICSPKFYGKLRTQSQNP